MRAPASGRSTTTRRSKRPGRSSAASRTSGRLVAAITTVRSLRAKPSISESSWLSVCSRSSCPPPRPRAARAADRVNLVDEDDRRRVLLRLLEQLAHARRADADEHLDELRRADRVERHARLTRDRAREQRLAGARRPDEQHAARDLRTELVEALRLLEELDDLGEVALRGREAGDVLERDARLFLLEPLPTLQKATHRTAAGDHHLLRASRHPEPEPADQHPRKQRDRDLEQRRRLLLLDADLDALVLEHRHQSLVVRRHERVERGDLVVVDLLGSLQHARDGVLVEHDFLDLALLDPAHDGRVVDVALRGRVAALPEPEQADHDREHDPAPRRSVRRRRRSGVHTDNMYASGVPSMRRAPAHGLRVRSIHAAADEQIARVDPEGAHRGFPHPVGRRLEDEARIGRRVQPRTRAISCASCPGPQPE